MAWKVFAVIVAIISVVIVVYATIRLGSRHMPVACTEEAKICPDGTSVSRTGAHCEFTQCPKIQDSSTSTPEISGSESVVLGLEQMGSARGVTIRPLEVVSDSRCPHDPQVQCIWAGTVELKIHVENASSSQDSPITLGSSVFIENDEIVFSEARPTKSVDREIATSTYQFTFQIRARTL